MSSENTYRGMQSCVGRVQTCARFREGHIQVCDLVLYMVCEGKVEDNEIIDVLNVVIKHGSQDQQIFARELINELQPVE